MGSYVDKALGLVFGEFISILTGKLLILFSFSREFCLYSLIFHWIDLLEYEIE